VLSGRSAFLSFLLELDIEIANLCAGCSLTEAGVSTPPPIGWGAEILHNAKTGEPTGRPE